MQKESQVLVDIFFFLELTINTRKGLNNATLDSLCQPQLLTIHLWSFLANRIQSACGCFLVDMVLLVAFIPFSRVAFEYIL